MQLVSYIAPGAPATRRPACGNEAFLRPEIGFTPKWYRQHLDIDFGARWHLDPAYRRVSILALRTLLRRSFPDIPVGCPGDNASLDLLTGLFGANTIAQIYGLRTVYTVDNWPNVEHRYLSDSDADSLEPPDLHVNSFFKSLISQVEWIQKHEGVPYGFINWQGVLNNAQRLRGQMIFVDMLEAPERATRIFECVARTMEEAAGMLQAKQKEFGFGVRFITTGNCLVNMVSPEVYGTLLLPFDVRLAKAFGCIGLHNCAWCADPYLDHYATIPHIGYIDMGQESDLVKAKALFPHARRAVMITPMDVRNKDIKELQFDLERIARDYGPCDVVLADIEAGTPDARVTDIVEICRRL